MFFSSVPVAGNTPESSIPSSVAAVSSGDNSLLARLSPESVSDGASVWGRMSAQGSQQDHSEIFYYKH